MKQFVLPENPEIENGESAELDLDGKAFHYLIRVRRHQVGDIFPGITRDGTRYDLQLEEILRDHCRISLRQVVKPVAASKEPATRITVIPAVTKGKKMDLTVRQAVESGTTAIWPVVTDHCQVNINDIKDKHSKTERWNRIADEALQQCGGSYPTKVDHPSDLDSAIERWNGRGPIFFLHEKPLKEPSSLHQHLAEEVDDLAIMVGPEGGFSNREIRILETLGAVHIFLGNRVLRAETAVLYGVAAISTIIRERGQWAPA